MHGFSAEVSPHVVHRQVLALDDAFRLRRGRGWRGWRRRHDGGVEGAAHFLEEACRRQVRVDVVADELSVVVDLAGMAADRALLWVRGGVPDLVPGEEVEVVAQAAEGARPRGVDGAVDLEDALVEVDDVLAVGDDGPLGAARGGVV